MGKQYKDQGYLDKVGEKLVALRLERNLSQEDLQKLTGFDARQIGRIERAESNSSISIIKAIADSLKISVGELVDV